MQFEIVLSNRAKESLRVLSQNPALEKRYKAVKKAIGYLANNPRHPSLNTHEFQSCTGPNGAKMFEAYAENNTPGAYRIFWCYGYFKGEITICDIIAHP